MKVTNFYFFQDEFSVLSIVAVGVSFFALIAGCALYSYMPVYKFKKTKKYQEEYNLTFSHDGIKFITPTINSELRWDVYSELWVSEDFYFLIQVPPMYALIPKRAFQNPAAMQRFEELVQSNVKCMKRM